MSVECFGMFERKAAQRNAVHATERLCAYYLSAVLSIIRHVFVPTDMFLKWNETSRGDKDLKSLCESNLKVPLRRLSFCSLKSGGVTGG